MSAYTPGLLGADDPLTRYTMRSFLSPSEAWARGATDAEKFGKQERRSTIPNDLLRDYEAGFRSVSLVDSAGEKR